MATEKQIEAIRSMRIIDDIFFEMMAKDKGFCEEILQVILEDRDLTVTEVIPQNSLKNIYGRSVRLDAHCILGNGTMCNVEVQKADNDDHLRRVRFNAACITTSRSETGSKFSEIPNVCVVYITQFDLFGKGKTTYHIDKVIRETGDIIDDGQREIYVNTAVNDRTETAELMQCFLQTEVVNNPKFPHLSGRMSELKETEGGRSSMCEVMEKYAKEVYGEEWRQEGRQEGLVKGKSDMVIELIKDGLLSVQEGARRLNMTESELRSQLYQS